MGLLEGIVVPDIQGLTIRDQADSIEMDGSIAIANPSEILGGFVRAVHQRAVESNLTEVIVDMRKLRFVNSSAIRLFVDWAALILKLPAAKQYRIKCLLDRKISWQRTSMPVLRTMAKGAVELDGL